MKRYKYSDLLNYEDKIKRLYEKYDLSINRSSRIFQYFSFLQIIENARKKSKKEFNKLIEHDKTKYYYSQYYVAEIQGIVDAIEQTQQDKNLVKSKLIDLANGTYLLSEENPEDTKSRNTSFELSLFSFLHKLGTRVRLGDPNPDLRVSTNKYIYNVECKRPASLNTIERNLKRARKQLRKSSVPPGIPTIALSLDKILLNDELIYHSLNEQSALQGLDKLLFAFSQENKKMLDKIYDLEACVVLYYLSCLAGFENKNLPMATATYMVGNVYNFETDLQRKIFEDLNVFSKNNLNI